jgi:hypothetical protein
VMIRLLSTTTSKDDFIRNLKENLIKIRFKVNVFVC